MLLSNKQILKEKETFELLSQKREKQGLTADEKRQLVTAKARMDSAVHPDTGEIIPRCFRFGIYLPVNIPIVLGMLLGPEKYFIHWHVFN